MEDNIERSLAEEFAPLLFQRVKFIDITVQGTKLSVIPKQQYKAVRGEIVDLNEGLRNPPTNEIELPE